MDKFKVIANCLHIIQFENSIFDNAVGSRSSGTIQDL